MNFLNIFIIIAVIIIYIQFAIRTNRIKRSLPFFPTSLIFLMIISILAALSNIIENIRFNEYIFALQITFTGIGYIVFYLFIENLIQYNRNHVKFAILCGLISVSIVLQWVISDLKINYSEIDLPKLILIFSDLSYYLAGIIVFGVMGIPVWLRLFRKSKRFQFVLMICSSLLITIGLTLLLMMGLISTQIGELAGTLESIQKISNIIAFFGLGILYLLIALDFLPLYYFPHENYALIVADQSGIVLFFVKFNNKHSKDLEEDLISGFLTAMNSMFQDTLQAKKNVRLISSENAELIIEKGEYTTTAFIAEQVSGLIAGDLKGFVNEFENKFKKSLKAKSTMIENYKTATELVHSRFPYFEIIN